MGRVCQKYFFRPWPFCPDGHSPEHFLCLFLCTAGTAAGVWTMDAAAGLCPPLAPDCPAADGRGLEGQSAAGSILFHAVIRSCANHHYECFDVEIVEEKAL